MIQSTVDVRGINLAGFLRSRTGVGTVARRYVRALRASGLPFALKDLTTLNPVGIEPQAEEAFDSEHPYLTNLVCVNAVDAPAFAWYVGEPFLREHYNVGVWFWELPTFPREWFDRFLMFDELWAPTAFIAGTLSAVAPIPVVRMPIPLAAERIGSRARGRARLNVSADDFVYLFVFDFGSYFERKNPLALVDAFRIAFDPDVAARLIIKCVNPEFDPSAYAQLQDRARGYPIDIVCGYWTADAMDDLVAACDAYVSLHRCEGLGLGMAEAMALGRPVIATDWSGNTDYMTVSNSLLVRNELVELDHDVGPYRAGSIWANPSVEHAAELMRHVYEDRDSAARIGEAARRTIERAFSAQRIGDMIDERMAVIDARRRAATPNEEAETNGAVELHAPDVPPMEIETSIYGWPGRLAKRGVAFLLSYHTLFQQQINLSFARFLHVLETKQHEHTTHLEQHDQQLGAVRLELRRMREDFEAALRTETVTRGQRVYVPLFEGCQRVVVLGAAGSEMLRLLVQRGVHAFGIDADHALVERAVARGLPMIENDALEYLSQTEDTVDAIFAACDLGSFDARQLLALLTAARSRLRPDGLFVAETESPEPAELVQNCFRAGFGSVRVAHNTLAQYAVVARTAPSAATDQAHATWMPMPPPELRFRVAGTEDEEWFDRSGRMTVDSFQAALRNLGRDLTEFSDIYDFGAGCGRALRHLIERVPRARVAASDSDGLAVEWLQRNWPTVDVRLNGGLPPLNFETGRFDLVLAFSVFTHLDEAYQDAWLAELQRVTRPGAILLLTVHGPWNWRDHLEKIPELAQHQQTLDQHGFLFYTGDQWSQYFADYYHTSFHQPWYIRDRWSKWFDVVDIAQSGAQPPQDLVVLRRA